ncbi:MAG: methyltransferase domain-containing protein [Chloroflexota bacterium]
MDRLTDATELLDGTLDDPATLAGNLRDLGRVNDRLGGVELSAAAIDALAAHRTELSLLDVGTGGADIPVALLERAAARGRQWSIVGLDSRPEVLAAAVLARPELAVTDGLELHVGDGTSLPYPDDSFDVVHCSLVVHHCTPDEAGTLFREMARVARLGIVVNDLDRRWLGWIGAMLMGHLLTRNRYTRNDAPLSVRRAYRADEMVAMLRAAGLAPVRIIRGSLRQRYAIAAIAAARTYTDDAGTRDLTAAPDPIGAGE